MNKQIIKTLALSGALLLSSQANAAYVSLDDLSTWGINSSGGGTTSGVILAVDYINFDGYSYTDSDASLTSFTDYGYLYVGSYYYQGTNAYAQFSSIPESTAFFLQDLNNTITAEFTDWTGYYTSYDTNEDEVNFAFDAGKEINWYSNDDLILTAEIVNGTGDLNLSGDLNGQINIQFEITSATEDYFFVDVNEDGVFTDDEELSYLLSLYPDDEPYYFGYSSSTNQIVDETNATLDALLADLGVTYDELTADRGDFITQNTGSYTMATIPEPGMLSLMGLAFLGMAGFQRRRKQQG
ncbi:PEP-CTERM sorting domain-containing protein [Vibrio sp. MA40-2]|uniref:PEP-CTERM sorting domain-containing protein n=1 Tax=Vibrio sp. MA40-2 TaxID=3391828 RepID=UPI0039A6F2B7